AIGVTPRVSRTVVDATAGLGVDAFMMACLDCRVTSIERSPAVYELLVDGFRRAVEDPELGGWLPEYLRFVHADAEAYLASLSHEERPDVVYLDPMYPHVDGKSALPKKEMQIFRKLLGPDTDSARVLERALHAATDRVVVKRPNEAPALLEGVTHAFVGKTARYDMYAVVRQSRISE
ncbi:MAG: class I SAM-dependent methyltransferase, partial [Bdellovibrionaceae bacterium]|nr:class I SAM-dependent methyltransferase [Pseudobdellovibrionaceae bacterium]